MLGRWISGAQKRAVGSRRGGGSGVCCGGPRWERGLYGAVNIVPTQKRCRTDMILVKENNTFKAKGTRKPGGLGVGGGRHRRKRKAAKDRTQVAGQECLDQEMRPENKQPWTVTGRSGDGVTLLGGQKKEGWGAETTTRYRLYSGGQGVGRKKSGEDKKKKLRKVKGPGFSDKKKRNQESGSARKEKYDRVNGEPNQKHDQKPVASDKSMSRDVEKIVQEAGGKNTEALSPETPLTRVIRATEERPVI